MNWLNSTTRVAINEVVESIDNLDRIILNDPVYGKSTLVPLKESLLRVVENMISQEAEYAKTHILDVGYVDDVSRIRKDLGLAHEDEYHA